jgi:serine protease Do
MRSLTVICLLVFAYPLCAQTTAPPVVSDGENAAPPSPTTQKSGFADRVWNVLGLKVAVINQDDFKNLNTRYRGGLAVLDVRLGSSAAQQGIRRGDILVGMHIWETISLENIAYIVEREDVRKLESVVFYIIRGPDTLYGHLRLPSR